MSRAGEICVSTLKKDWSPAHTLAHILVTIKCLLIYPNPESALDDDAGKLLLENYQDYCARARIVTQVHATPKVRSGPCLGRLWSQSDPFAEQTRPPEFDEPKREASAPPASSRASAEPDAENVPASSSSAKSAPSTATVPLQPSNSNAPAPAPAPAAEPVKAAGVKRPATSAIDKRKKALKRL